MNTRVEKDFIGELTIPADALYGIQSLRAKHNFPDQSPFQPEWYKATGLVKLACYQTVQSFYRALHDQHPDKNWQFRVIADKTLDALCQAATEVSEGLHYEHFIVPGISGGAGTSINMNVNEIIANRSLQMLGHQAGEYDVIDPIEDANIFQSTNDVIPTALHVAAMQLLNSLETTINEMRTAVEKLESRYRNTLRIGYTQMQEAVPSGYGKLFSAYSDMLSRDWWRVSKCFERLKAVNLGGSAIGTSIGLPRFYLMEVNQNLQKLSGMPVNKAENLIDATSNLDAFTEVHATLKAHAVNLEKMLSDIRLLASDLYGSNEFHIPQKQIGSTIMPGKVNPVIPEFGISVAHKIYANDQLISSLCGLSCLELNAYIPLIGDAMLQSIKLLIQAGSTITTNLLDGITIDQEASQSRLFHSPAITTALSPFIGYNKASELAHHMKNTHCSVFEANKELGFLDEAQLILLLQPDNLLKSGFSVNDLNPEE